MMRYLTQLKIAGFLLVLVMLAGCSSASRSFNRGERLEEDGRFEEAMLSYADAFAKDPQAGIYRVRFFGAREKAAEQRFRQGRVFFDKKDYAAALENFQAAFGLDPTQERFKQHAAVASRLKDAQQAYREGLDFEKANKLKDAMRSFSRAMELDSANKDYHTALSRVTGMRKNKLEGYELNLKSAKPITLKFKDAKIKDVFSIITQLSGINFIFDEGVKDQPVSIYIENATFQQVMDLLTNMHKLGTKVANESTMIIYPLTPDKKKQYEDMQVRTFHLNYMDAKKAVNLIRTMIQVRKIYVNEDSNSVVVRDTSDVVDVVDRILEANDVPDPEVVLDVEVVEVSDKNAQNVGLLLSNYNVQLGAFNGSTPLASSLTSASTSTSGTTTATPYSIENLVRAFALKGYGGFVTVPTAQYNLGKTLTKGEVLSNPKIRVKNKEKSKFNVGTRVPITTTTLNGTLSQVNVQYVDVGVKVNAEPNIQLNNEIVIKLSLEVSSILSKETVGGKDSPTTVVTIGTRNLDTVLSLKDGETSVIGGLIQNTNNDSKQKIFLLGDLPLIGPLISNNDMSKDKTELILAITPRLVRGITVPQGNLMAFISGREDDPSLGKTLASFEQEPAFDAPPSTEKDMAAKTPARKQPVAGTVSPQQSAQPVQPTVNPLQNVTNPILPPSPSPVPMPAPQKAPDASSAATPAIAVVPASPVQAVAAAPAQAVPKVAPVEQKTSTTAGATATTPAAPVPTATTSAATPVTAPGQVPVKADQATVPATVQPTVPAQRGLLQIITPNSVTVGQLFTLDIKVSEVRELTAAPFVLTYDPIFTEFVSAAEGGFLKQGGKPTTFSSRLDAVGGTVSVNLARAVGSGGASGAGSLASMVFRAKNQGPAGFGFRSVTFTAADGKPVTVLPFSTAIDIK